MIRDLSLFKLGEINKCETCEIGYVSIKDWIDDEGHLMEEIISCQEDCPYYRPPIIRLPDGYEPVMVDKFSFTFRPVFKEEQPQ